MAISLDQISQQFLNIDNDALPNDSVGVAVLINNLGEAQHSAIVIKVEQETYLFHYTGQEVKNEKPPQNGKWYYCKELKIIEPDTTLTFLLHCTKILQNAQPTYGFIFDGSYYKDGIYFSKSGIKEYTTCVGFCISVVAGFLYNHKYFELNDWNEDSTEEYRDRYTAYFDQQLQILEASFPDKVFDYKKNYLKRITPAEYTSSAFINILPVTKEAIDVILDDVVVCLNKIRFDPANV